MRRRWTQTDELSLGELERPYGAWRTGWWIDDRELPEDVCAALNDAGARVGDELIVDVRTTGYRDSGCYDYPEESSEEREIIAAAVDGTTLPESVFWSLQEFARTDLRRIQVDECAAVEER